MMKKARTLMAIILITHLPLSCINEVDCGGFQLLEARITELTTFIGSYDESSFSGTISRDFERAAINVSITDMEYTEISQVSRKGWGFISSAYACSPPEPEPTQAINLSKITSESPVYAEGRVYAEGEDLMDLFQVSEYNYGIGPISVDQFIQLQNDDLWIFGYAGANAIFQLRDQPDSTVNQRFAFEFEFSDSATLTVETTGFKVDGQ